MLQGRGQLGALLLVDLPANAFGTVDALHEMEIVILATDWRR